MSVSINHYKITALVEIYIWNGVVVSGDVPYHFIYFPNLQEDINDTLEIFHSKDATKKSPMRSRLQMSCFNKKICNVSTQTDHGKNVNNKWRLFIQCYFMCCSESSVTSNSWWCVSFFHLKIIYWRCFLLLKVCDEWVSGLP